jgi:phage terminase large subunit
MLTPPKPWPPDYLREFVTRANRVDAIKADARLRLGLAQRYRNDPVAWINHWAVTYDPRNAGSDVPTLLPFVLFPKQAELAEFLLELLQAQANGLVEKSRDMGATWLCCAFSVWLWLYWPGAAIGWGSRKEALVDKIGDPDSIMEKIRIIIRHLPRFMRPPTFDEKEHMPFMKIVNPETGATITGEAGDNIGRGGRKLIYFKDESAHYERPEKIEAALSDTTNCQIDFSSVNGLGNVFHRRREAGQIRLKARQATCTRWPSARAPSCTASRIGETATRARPRGAPLANWRNGARRRSSCNMTASASVRA